MLPEDLQTVNGYAWHSKLFLLIALMTVPCRPQVLLAVGIPWQSKCRECERRLLGPHTHTAEIPQQCTCLNSRVGACSTLHVPPLQFTVVMLRVHSESHNLPVHNQSCPAVRPHSWPLCISCRVPLGRVSFRTPRACISYLQSIQWNLFIMDKLGPASSGSFLLLYRGCPLSEVKMY